jgi:hypothetical protein
VCVGGWVWVSDHLLRVAFDVIGSALVTEQEDCEFECVEVLTGHTQDVKHVQWHPTEDV